MNILCLDTSGEKIAIGLVKGDNKFTFISEEDNKKHNSVLLEHIDTILHNNNLSIQDIDCFSVVVGPGSFTGIRVGVATINSFALALEKPIVEITSLEQLIDDEDVVAILDCKHGNYYCAVKTGDNIEYIALNDSELANYNLKKVELIKAMPDKLIEKTLIKINKKEYVNQAKPFYLKKSSAERETGIDG
ncbi:MAG TPA: tRNA (adenosine(37)-N6)-threonylcarbamoyltransferase complex dimerization subunit type 1 TsaB [Clostridia bacterium]|nr:tRNA (adenosine(37)-N6)-threonylcarbamoyltransferase complex dimerization subunit type 1 TsaB [Clostridia bacterium]